MEVKKERLTLDLAPRLLTLAEAHRRAQKREHAPDRQRPRPEEGQAHIGQQHER